MYVSTHRKHKSLTTYSFFNPVASCSEICRAR